MAWIRKAWIAAAVVLLAVGIFFSPALADGENYAIRGDGCDSFTFTVQSYGSAVLDFSQDQGVCRIQSTSYSGSESEVYEWGKYRILVQTPNGSSYSERWDNVSDGTYSLKLSGTGSYRIQVVPYLSTEITSSWTGNRFLYWINYPGWWVSGQRNCTVQSGTSAVVKVQQAEAESGTVLGSRSVVLYSGANTVQAGTTPSGYELLSDTERTVYVDIYGKTALETITFWYQKTAPSYGTVTVYCYDRSGNWITSYTETIYSSQILAPRKLTGYNTVSSSRAVVLNDGVCSPSVITFYYEAVTPVTPVPVTPVPVTPVPVTPVPVTPVPVPPAPSADVVQPASWDTQFKPGTTNPGSYNDKRYERLGNLSDNNYYTSFEWLVWSGERTDSIPELTANFNGDTVSSIGIRNGYLGSAYEYKRYARATGLRIKIFDTAGTEYQTYIKIPDSYSTEYRVYSLGGTYSNVSRIEIFLDAFACDETEDNGHRYVIHISDIQFYK